MTAVVGISTVRDEEDVLSAVLHHMVTQVDALIIADNRSVDRTPEILEHFMRTAPIPVLLKVDDEVGYQQSAKMSALAEQAFQELNAEWVVPFDADEIWYAPTRRLADFLEALPVHHDVVEARVYDHVASGFDDSEETNPIERIQWRRNYPLSLRKVACRYRPGLTIEMGNHGATYQDFSGRLSDRCIAIRHFPYRSPEQVVRKVRNGAEAYAATDLPAEFGAHWRQWGRILDEHGEGAIHNLFHQWYYRSDPSQSITIDGEIQGPLLCDPAPIR